ncbi:MAG: hypothetical protein LQ342_004465 [Letrouitia transgressa]|nr:MAG: hypothetical protein LQ342_004465 [Letrouitia transgressa]
MTNANGVITGQPVPATSQPPNDSVAAFPTQPNVVTEQPSAVTTRIERTIRASGGPSDTSIKSTSQTSHPSATSITTAKGSKNTSLAAGAKTGIAIGAIFGFLILCILCILACRQRWQWTTRRKAPLDPTTSEFDRGLDQPAIGELSGKRRSSNVPELDHVSIHEAPNDISIADLEVAELSSATIAGNQETRTSLLSLRNNKDRHYRLDHSTQTPMLPKPETEPVPEENPLRSSLQDALAPESSDMDNESLARLKEEEQRLEKEIATVERLTNLRAQRDAVRERIRDMQNKKDH